MVIPPEPIPVRGFSHANVLDEIAEGQVDVREVGHRRPRFHARTTLQSRFCWGSGCELRCASLLQSGSRIRRPGRCTRIPSGGSLVAVGRPSLVLVSGSPGSGKTTLAHAVGTRLPCPVVSRDEIKEGLVHAGGGEKPDWGAPVAYQTFALFYRIVGELIRSRCSVVAEAAYLKDLTREITELLSEADACVVHCQVDRDVAMPRFIERAASDPIRRESHPDAEILAAMQSGAFEWERYEPMELGIPVLLVDTTNGYEPMLDDVVAFSRAH
jgi:predicted kinase